MTISHLTTPKPLMNAILEGKFLDAIKGHRQTAATYHANASKYRTCPALETLTKEIANDHLSIADKLERALELKRKTGL